MVDACKIIALVLHHACVFTHINGTVNSTLPIGLFSCRNIVGDMVYIRGYVCDLYRINLKDLVTGIIFS